jgi:hypothetical protein
MKSLSYLTEIEILIKPAITELALPIRLAEDRSGPLICSSDLRRCFFRLEVCCCGCCCCFSDRQATQLRIRRTNGNTMKNEAEPKPKRILVMASFFVDGRSAKGNHWTALISLRVRGTNFESCGTPGITYRRVSWSLT